MTLQEKLQKLVDELDNTMDQMDPDDSMIGQVDQLHERAELALKRATAQPKDSMEIYEYLTMRFRELQPQLQLETA